MSKIQFSITLDQSLFKASELVTLFTEIETQVNAGLSSDQFKLNTIRYRHLEEPVYFGLSARALGLDIDTLGHIPHDGNQYTTERPYLEFQPTFNKNIAIVVETWYYGYYYQSLNTKFGYAKRNASTLVYTVLPNTEINYGVDRADPNGYSAFAPLGGGGGSQAHYMTGVAGWLPPSAGLQRPVIVTAAFGPSSVSEETAYGFDRYKTTIRMQGGTTDAIGVFDRLYMFAYARDNGQ
jgi:hypothetical protein